MEPPAKRPRLPNANTADDQRRALLESLRFDQMDARQLNIKRTHAHTCVWFLNTPEYVNWTQRNTMHDNHNFLWIKGKPGAGKSTLMKFLFGRLSDRVEQAKNQEVLLSFFFNARGDDLEKTTAGLYRSLLLQLLKARPDLQFVLDNARIGHRWTVESLKNLFGEAIRKLGNTSLIFLIDALDECEEEQIRDMVFFLSDPDIIQHQHRICFASRHYPHITVPTARSIVLEAQSGHSEDIASYVNRYLVIEDSSLAEQIRCDLQEKASGVFMWVVLVVGILNKDYDEGRGPVLRTRIQELPKDLHDLFFDILTRDKNNMDNLLLCIQWILFAWKPLTPEQLYFAIISGREPDNLQRYHSGDAFGYDMNKYILSSSKGLAESTKSSKPTVQFIHESVRDFLLKDGGLNRLWPDLRTNVPGLSHDRLKQCCQTYMCMREVQDPKGFGPKAITSAFPFLDYAHQGILYHADQAQRHHVSQREFLTTFPRSQWVKHHNILSVLMNCYTPEVTLLYILAETGMAALIRAQPNRQSCFEVENERYGVPALAASATKSSEAIQTMLDLEAERLSETSLANLYSLMPPSLDIKYPSGRNFTFKKAEDLWHQLIEYGNEKLLLFFFSAEGCDIHLLIDRGADISATNKDGKSPLYTAATCGQVEMVKLLIHHGANISATNKDGKSPLYAAATCGQVEMAKLLIHHGADVSATNKDGKSPLYVAATHGYVKMVKLLIHHGADVSATNKDGKSPLYVAATHGHVEMVKLLIHHGADVWSRCDED
ncbi:hypothetical protein F4803DRAFT_565241 [Xylaria telfairii]|nr:hypothetical protein F4803DRAFT_565241 [Xylaria telfairii]